MPARGHQKRPRDAGDTALTALHRNRLVSWQVAPIVAIAACPDGSAIAAGYENGKVEIFSATTLHCITTVPGQDGLELSSLAWAKAESEDHWRLFCATLTGDIFEVDCQRLARVAPTDSYGGAVWTLSSCPGSSVHSSSLLAAGCDDGSVRLFSVQAGLPGAAFQRTLAQVEGRCLALAWHPTATMLLSGGSDGAIHCWDTTTGQELLRITAASHTGASLCVWALLVTADGTIVSGDSEGAVQFWDGASGTLLTRLQRHAADVLALAEWRGSVWAAGVDPRVALFQRVADPTTGAPTWAYLEYKAPHTHDVRALALLPARAPGAGQGEGEGEEALLLSGGNDGQLIMYPAERFTKVHPTRQCLSPQTPLLQLAPAGGSGRLLQVSGRGVSLWQLAEAGQGGETGGGAEGDALEVHSMARHLALIHTHGPHHITCAAISPDGHTIAVADAAAMRLFALEAREGGEDAPQAASTSGRQQQDQLVVRRRKLHGQAAAPSLAMAFAADGDTLVVADAEGVVRTIAVDSGEVGGRLDLQQALTPAAAARSKKQLSSSSSSGAAGWLSQRWGTPPVRQLTVSPDGQWLAVTTGDDQVVLVTLPSLTVAGPLLLVGTPGAAVTAVTFSPDSSLVVVATDANDCSAYQVSNRQPSEWSLSQQEALSDILEKLPGSIRGLSFDPAHQSRSLLVSSPGGLCHVDMTTPLTPLATTKRPRHRPQQQPPGSQLQGHQQQQQQQQGVDPRSACGVNGRLLLLENPCLLVGHWGPGQALMVEKPWADVLQQLPPPMYRHRYGS